MGVCSGAKLHGNGARPKDLDMTSALTTRSLELPFTSIPLSMNDRHHWARKAKITRQIRDTVRILAIAHRLPRDLTHVVVELHYAPSSNRRLDADNLVATLKPCADALVDFGMVPDDVPSMMTKLMPVIEPKDPGGKGRLWLELSWGGAA